MYLSCLLIDLGDNPDRPRPGRLWLRNIYHVHQRLCMAFPSASRKSDDADFLKPFNPGDFGNGQVDVIRAADSGFLFRIDPMPNGRAVILVQSAVKPDWDYAFHNAGYFLAAPSEVKSFEPCFTKEQRLWFRLVANPTRRLSKNSPDVKKESIGKRVPVPTDKLLDWLSRKGEGSGFSIDKDLTTVQPGYIYCKKPKNRQEGDRKDKREDSGRRRSVRFEGVLDVTDPVRFYETLIRGIGSGKAFGFGLLSVVPVNTSCLEEAT
ncbi:MAG: type I-E CRISPR-associated protein Cas6/Cse3/CasE [bacterium]|nr:type I-E CRISPR-associated protein Cas6/Cse3/CasE [bacterium]